MNGCFLVGAGSGAMNFSEDCFPLDGFTGVHDPTFARIAVIEYEERIAICTIDTTNISSVYPEIQNCIHAAANVPFRNIWIIATHSTGLPHTSVPPFFPDAEVMNRRGKKMEQIILAAVQEAAAAAVSRLQPANIFLHTGESSVNVCRDIRTLRGWWKGIAPDGPSDHTLKVIEAVSEDGAPAAILFTLGLMPEVMVDAKMSDGGYLTTADLCGAACKKIEEAIGQQNMTAMFCPAAHGDQVPAQKACWETFDENGDCTVHNLGEKGYEIVDALGAELCEDVLRTRSMPGMKITGPVSAPVWQMIDFVGQKPDGGGPDSPKGPCRTLERTRVGIESSAFGIIQLGNLFLLAIRAAATCDVGRMLLEKAPENTMLFCGVNDAQKCLPTKQAYDWIQYGSINTRMGRGSAEKLIRCVGWFFARYTEKISEPAPANVFSADHHTFIVSYGQMVSGQSVAPQKYQIANKNIINAYTSPVPQAGNLCADGSYVILETEDAALEPSHAPANYKTAKVLQSEDIMAADGSCIFSWQQAIDVPV